MSDVIGGKSTMRNTVPPFGGVNPTRVFPRSVVQAKSGGYGSVTQMLADEFPVRGLLISGTMPSTIATALPDASSVVTMRRISPVCCGGCASPEPASVNTMRRIVANTMRLIDSLREYFGKSSSRSCRDRRVLAQDSGDLPPAVDPAQLDLPSRH